MSAGNSICFGFPRIKRCNNTGMTAAAKAPRKSENVVKIIVRNGITLSTEINRKYRIDENTKQTKIFKQKFCLFFWGSYSPKKFPQTMTK
jgi:hypothetical protein